MSLEALAGLCCDVEALNNSPKPSPSPVEIILNRVPLSRNSSTDNKLMPLPLSRNTSYDMAKFISMSRNQSTDSACSILSPPLLSRQTSNNRANNEWVKQVTLEERCFIKDKIKAAYRKKASTYEDLLDICAAIDEELLFVNAPSRLDYFKSGTQFDRKVTDKAAQMSGIVGNNTASDENEITKKPKLQ